MPNTPLDERCINAVRFLAVDAVQQADSGHPGMPLGASATAYALWARHLRFDPSAPDWLDRDRYVLSAGHASAMLYALLHLCGYAVSIEDLRHFRQWGSRTPGHPEFGHTAGVEATTGPLGQGIANAIGMAIAAAHQRALYNDPAHPLFDHRIYVHCGDGDLMEGLSQEALSLAGHLRLGNLAILYDDNRVSLAAATEVTYTEDRDQRFRACGWHVEVVELEDGNDVDVIDAAIARANAVTDKPALVRVRTHIGYGSPLHDSYKVHGEPLGVENVLKTKEQLDWPTQPTFLVPDDVRAAFAAIAQRGTAQREAWDARRAAWSAAQPQLAAQLERTHSGMIPENLPWPEFTAENGSIATRDAGGITMNAIANALPELIGGSADLDPSTKTYLKEQGDFQPGTQSGRNIHFGVREHVMGAIANGIAYHGGFIPFTATFFNFLDYMKPAVRLAAPSKIHVIFLFTHDSVFLGEDGPTHQPVEQLAMLRATPQLTVIRPADALEVREAWKLAIQPQNGPSVIVLSRQKLPFLGARDADVARGAYTLAKATGAEQLILIATGSEVSLALEAKKLLDARGVATSVVSMPSWERFAMQPTAYRESILPQTVTQRVSIEAGATLGWERYVGQSGLCIGIDHFGASAPMAQIAEHFGFTPEGVVETIAAHFHLSAS